MMDGRRRQGFNIFYCYEMSDKKIILYIVYMLSNCNVALIPFCFVNHNGNIIIAVTRLSSSGWLYFIQS